MSNTTTITLYVNPRNDLQLAGLLGEHDAECELAMPPEGACDCDERAVENFAGAYREALDKLEPIMGIDIRTTRQPDRATSWRDLRPEAAEDVDGIGEILAEIWQAAHDLLITCADGWAVCSPTAKEIVSLRRLATALRADEIAEIAEAVEEAAAGWTGCDWPSDEEGIDLDGERAEDWGKAAEQARQANRLRDLPEHFGTVPRSTVLLSCLPEECHPEEYTLGTLARCAREAWGEGGAAELLREVAEKAARLASWLEEVEGDAEGAAAAGREAVRALREGRWADALEQASWACRLEQEYGDCPTWRPVQELVRAFVGEE